MNYHRISYFYVISNNFLTTFMTKVLHSIDYYYDKFNDYSHELIKEIYKFILYSIHIKLDTNNGLIKHPNSDLHIKIYHFNLSFNSEEYMKCEDLYLNGFYYLKLTDEHSFTSDFENIDFENLNYNCVDCVNCKLCMECLKCENCIGCKYSSNLKNCNGYINSQNCENKNMDDKD